MPAFPEQPVSGKARCVRFVRNEGQANLRALRHAPHWNEKSELTWPTKKTNH
jgi:hypothetical protein